MQTSSRQRSYSEALNQEANKLRAIAERLGISIERFESFMATQIRMSHSTALDFSSLRDDDDCQELARKLQEEHRLLIAAWEQLERDQRELLYKPERLQIRSEAAAPKPAAERVTDSTVLPPVTPHHTVSETNISKRLQFQHLQREIDRRR